jgi:3-hydroxybutyryl-CoA dehydrogenase
MALEPIQRVVIVGSGVMGRGIASTFAKPGFSVALMSRDPRAVKDLPSAISVVSEPPADPAPDLVIESIPERLDLKQALFRRLDELYGGRTILASNTSGLSLEDIARATRHPEMVVGLHYFQPAEAFEFVELAEVANTRPDVIDRMTAALAKTGKHTLHLRKPVVGLLINRLQHAMAHEAYHMIDNGVADAATIDLVLKRMLGPRLSVTGLCEQKDWAGVVMHAQAQQGIVPHLYHNRTPGRCCQELAAAGHDGVRTGRGFYDWQGKDATALRRKNADKLARILAIASE